MSTYFPVSARAFAMFVLTIGASQAAIESYLQTSVVAVASLYGPQALQAMMSGQAAVAVVVSSVQVLSSAMFIWKSNTQRHTTEVAGQANTESATRVFFALSTLFLIISALAHNTLVSKANYKIFIAPLEQPSVPRREIAGTEHLLAAPIVQESYSSQKHRIVRVAKTNITFEVAVAYVFIVTLSPSSNLPTTPIITSDLFFMLILLAFGVSNGYVSSLCMMSAPSLDHNQRLENRKEDVDVAATIVNFSLVAGLALGSIASFAVMSVVCGCNPFSHSTP
ncbi:hypothetical protein H0H87_001498 [Tephrocybe sp. NHM501043]|nr:hypothetical protein H0H87_001498 [Tephrocybe sp. NHM501043]